MILLGATYANKWFKVSFFSILGLLLPIVNFIILIYLNFDYIKSGLGFKEFINELKNNRHYKS